MSLTFRGVDPIPRSPATRPTAGYSIHCHRNPNLYLYVGNDPVNRSDPTGECPNCITALIGAVAGGIGGAGIEAVRQVVTTGSISDLGGVGTAALGGAVAGGVTGFTGNPVAGGAAGGFVQSGADALRADPHNVGGAFVAATEGGIVGGVVGAGGKYLTASGRGAMGTNAIARNEKMVNMVVGRIAQGQVRQVSPTTAAKIIGAAATKSVIPSAIGSATQRATSCAADKSKGGC